MCPFPFVIASIRNWMSMQVWHNGVLLSSTPVGGDVSNVYERCLLISKATPKKKKGQKTLCHSMSSCLRNLHVNPRQRESKRKQSSCLYSVKILSVPVSSAAFLAGRKAEDPTQSISPQGQQCVCDQTSSSHDSHDSQCTLIYNSLSLPS